MNFFIFSCFGGQFGRSRSGSKLLILRIRWPIWIRIRNTAFADLFYFLCLDFSLSLFPELLERDSSTGGRPTVLYLPLAPRTSPSQKSRNPDPAFSRMLIWIDSFLWPKLEREDLIKKKLYLDFKNPAYLLFLKLIGVVPASRVSYCPSEKL